MWNIIIFTCLKANKSSCVDTWNWVDYKYAITIYYITIIADPTLILVHKYYILLNNIIFSLFQFITIATVAFHLYQLGLNITNDYYDKDEKFRNFDHLDSTFGSAKDSLGRIIVLTYYTTYIAIAMMLFLFAIILTCGAYKVRTFFLTCPIIILAIRFHYFFKYLYTLTPASRIS